MIDAPIAQLVIDLERRGLLERTLIVLASEFSRDIMIEGVDGSFALTSPNGGPTLVRAEIPITGAAIPA